VTVIVGQFLEAMAAIEHTDVIAADMRVHGRNFDVRHRVTHEPLELRSHQPPFLPVTIGHDARQVLGQVRHLEMSAQPGNGYAVCDIDAELPDDLALYFSLQGRGRRDDFELAALGVTTDPSTIGLSPLRSFPGEVRELDESLILRMRKSEPHLAGILTRAKAAARARRYGQAIVVEDRAAKSYEDWYPDERPPGPIRYSGHVGRVIAVR
jgi:hypothetical protein